MKAKNLNIKTLSLVLMMLMVNIGFSQQSNIISQSTISPDI